MIHASFFDNKDSCESLMHYTMDFFWGVGIYCLYVVQNELIKEEKRCCYIIILYYYIHVY